jgi:hypothetical protein
MGQCNDIIEKIYIHPDINSLIKKIKPESIQDDLRQEIAISLLEMPCEKVAALFAGDNLLRYAIKTCWIMATSKTSKFFYTYKKNDIRKAIEYLEYLQQGCNFQPSDVNRVNLALKNKSNTTIHEDHERRIFDTYVRLGGIRQVARYYGLSPMHVSRVVAKVKSELKCILSQ